MTAKTGNAGEPDGWAKCCRSEAGEVDTSNVK